MMPDLVLSKTLRLRRTRLNDKAVSMVALFFYLYNKLFYILNSTT